MKQQTPVLVVLGNPPYNGYAGMAVDEERELSTAYRTTRLVRRPEGQGLNDLYVRFFRMAERRITEKTGQGVVCFISNYSWLDGLSFTGMRERFLQEFDAVRIDNLHGDRIISEYAPDGRTSETVFALRGQSPGIRVGTSIAMLSKTPTSSSAEKRVLYRDFDQARAEERRQALLESLNAPVIDSGYSTLEPNLELGLPFKPMAVSDDWYDWPELPDLFPVLFPGVQTKRDRFLIPIRFDYTMKTGHRLFLSDTLTELSFPRTSGIQSAQSTIYGRFTHESGITDIDHQPFEDTHRRLFRSDSLEPR